MNVPCYDCDGSGDVDGIFRDADEEESRCSHCSGTGWCSCATCGERYAEAHPEDLISRIIEANRDAFRLR